MLAFKDKNPSPGKLFVYGITLLLVSVVFIDSAQNLQSSIILQLKLIVWIILFGDSIYLIVLSFVRKVKQINHNRSRK